MSDLAADSALVFLPLAKWLVMRIAQETSRIHIQEDVPPTDFSGGGNTRMFLTDAETCIVCTGEIGDDKVGLVAHALTDRTSTRSMSTSSLCRSQSLRRLRGNDQDTGPVARLMHRDILLS